MFGTGIILAGGKSKRFKTNKALVMIESRRLIDRIAEMLASVFPKIILVTNTPGQYEMLKVPKVMDIIPGKGPLSGIHAGLISSPTELNFIMACDMPFIDGNAIRYLFDQTRDGDDVVVPIVNGFPEPLAAVYRKTCIKPIEDSLLAERHQVISFYPYINIKHIPEAELMKFCGEDSFFNMNTRDDFHKAVNMKKKK